VKLTSCSGAEAVVFSEGQAQVRNWSNFYMEESAILRRDFSRAGLRRLRWPSRPLTSDSDA